LKKHQILLSTHRFQKSKKLEAMLIIIYNHLFFELSIKHCGLGALWTWWDIKHFKSYITDNSCLVIVVESRISFNSATDNAQLGIADDRFSIA